MSGYLQRLVDTAAGRGEAVHPRTGSIFSPRSKSVTLRCRAGKKRSSDDWRSRRHARTRRHANSNRRNRLERVRPGSEHSSAAAEVRRARRSRPRDRRRSLPAESDSAAARARSVDADRTPEPGNVLSPPKQTCTSPCRRRHPAARLIAFRPVMKPTRVSEPSARRRRPRTIPAASRRASRTAAGRDSDSHRPDRSDAVPPPAPRAAESARSSR